MSFIGGTSALRNFFFGFLGTVVGSIAPSAAGHEISEIKKRDQILLTQPKNVD
jgi:hypothetical protein